MKTMKALCIGLILAASGLSALAQGKITFVNSSDRLFVLGTTLAADAGLGGGSSSPGSPTGAIPTTSPLPSGKTLTAILYAGTNSASLTLQATQVLAGAAVVAPGRMGSKLVILAAGIPGGVTNSFQIFVTDTDAVLPTSITGGAVADFPGGSYFGTSGLFTAKPGSTITYPALAPSGTAALSTWPQQNLVINAVVPLTPVIKTNPISRFIAVGGNVTFSAVAIGTAPLSYQWNKDGSPISGATGTSYSISGVTTNDTGGYDLLVSNPFGSTNSAVATLTVGYPPSIDTQPASQSIVSGNPAVLNVAASGTPPLIYQWRLAGGDLAGSTDSAYSIDPALTNHSGTYSIVITNAFGSITSAPANLAVYIPVALTLSPADQVAAAGGSVTFAAGASGYPAPTYQWSFGATPISGATGANLNINNVDLSKLGAYTVAASNPYSAVTSSPANLYMSPSISTAPTATTAIWGREGSLSVGAIGSGSLTYQWYKDGEALAGATSSSLTFTSSQFTNAGNYSVVVTSTYGSYSNNPVQFSVSTANLSLALYPGLNIQGTIGDSYDIQYTTNYADLNAWHTVTNITLTESSQIWVDTNPGTMPRLYRVVTP